MTDRLGVKPVLRYWHCDIHWGVEDGPTCPMDHDTLPYDNMPRRGRLRRVWICQDSEGGVGYLSRKAFLKHDEEWCWSSNYE